jgi:hypothetical protein
VTYRRSLQASKLIPISYLLTDDALMHIDPSWHILRLPHKYFVEKIARYHRVISLYGLHRRVAGIHPFLYDRMPLGAGSDSP